MASTQENPHSTTGPRVTVEQLLHLKRLEQPEAEFWTRFERDFKQRQLQALMKPRRSARLRAWIGGRQPVFGTAVAAAACLFAVLLVVSPFRSSSGEGEFAAGAETAEAPDQPMLLAYTDSTAFVDLPVADGEAALSPAAEARFIVDALAGQREPVGSARPFRTESQPRTLFAAVDGSSDYGVPSFTRGNSPDMETGARSLQF